MPRGNEVPFCPTCKIAMREKVLASYVLTSIASHAPKSYTALDAATPFLED